MRGTSMCRFFVTIIHLILISVNHERLLLRNSHTKICVYCSYFPHSPYKIHFFRIFFSIFLHISIFFRTFAPQNKSFAV